MEQFNLLSENGTLKMREYLKSKLKTCKVFLCIGTDRIISDGFGPMVGSALNDNMNRQLFVYGTQNNCVDATNLLCCYAFVKALHFNEQIAVIDAGVGTAEQVGFVQVYDGGLLPGAATNKNLPKVGDIAIVGIVSQEGMGDFYTSTSAKANLVKKMANATANAIGQA